MKTAKILACCLLTFPLVGTLSRPAPHSRAKSLPPSDDAARLSAFKGIMRDGGLRFVEGRYGEARVQFESARQFAFRAGHIDWAARATGNIAGCLFALHQYQPALKSYLEADRLAASAHDRSTAAVLDANIASLYSQLGEVDAAVEWMRGSLARTTGELRDEHLPELQITMGSLQARQKHLDEARWWFRQGIDGAARLRNPNTLAHGWTRLGEELLWQNQLPAAERALLEAYRIRKLNHLPLETSYCILGKLRLAEGDLVSASTLMDRAVEKSRDPHEPIPGWHVFLTRGQVRLAQRRLPEALTDLRVALRLARAFRWSAPTADATQIGAEGILGQVHSALIEAANRLYLETHDPALIRESFEASEENRANSLRQLASGPNPDLPDSYWEALAALQRAEVAALRGNDPGTEDALQSARATILRVEASFNPNSLPLDGHLLDRAQAALGPDSVLLSFQLGDSISWMWALDRGGLTLHQLPRGAEIRSQVQSAARAIRDDAPDSTLAGARLYNTLFGSLSPGHRSKTRWLLALDQELLDVPVAALPEDTRNGPAYVAERHITGVTPGVGYWLESIARERTHPLSPTFLGVGDPIYNNADPRVAQRLTPVPAGVLTAGWPTYAAIPIVPLPLVLPRLVGSASELDQCARYWHGERVLLTGAMASSRNLALELRRKPAIVHFATHFLESPEQPSYSLIALSLTNRHETELLTPMEIAHWRIQAGLVVLSGCHSAAGGALPGTGLLGLTRAWLIAGARSVLASRWTTPDDGDLFTEFYRDLSFRSHADAMQSLRAAQLQMIRSGGWRARPRYWGAYFVMGSQ